MVKAIVPKKKRKAVIVKKANAPRRKKEKEAAPAPSRPTLRKQDTSAKKTTTTAEETIEQQILRITDAKPRGKSESMADYTVRLAGEIDSDEKYWDQLNKEAKDWFSAAVKAINKDKDPPAFDADDADADDGVGEEDTDTGEVEEGTDTEGEEEETEAMQSLVEIIVDDPEIDGDTLWKKAKKAKLDLGEEDVRSAHPIIVATLTALDDAGRLK